MNFRWTFVLSLIALSLLAWFYEINYEKKANTSFVNKTDHPSYIGEGMSSTVFNQKGGIKYIANAKKMTYFEQKNHTYFQEPQVFVFDEKDGKVQEWEMNANQAILNNKTDILLLTNDVKIQSLLVSSPLQQILTSKVEINLNTQDVSSNEKATVIGQNFTTTGLQLVGNLKTQLATLKKQVNTHYDKHEK